MAAMAVLALVLSLQAGAPARAAGLSFAAQAEQAGLSSQQAKALQSKVDHYLEATGGKQVSPNEIDYKDGNLRVVIPGEAHPRDFSSKAAKQVTADHCNGAPKYNGYFCAYSGSYYTGDTRQWYTCGTYSMPFHHGGSWINNQTKNQAANMYNSNGDDIFWTFAFDEDPTGDWWHVWTVELC
ncbi:hypothetical protein ACIRVK_44395 [Streptomyces sp. NPDC101152]|uniref:hypothetical protein n=1 Tax=Streptomyces sp. NPDC101152 TaxID=3366116 RepID=UPI00382E6ACA